MISSEQAAITVTEGEEIESETVKDADCQTIEFDYMFQTSRYQAPKNDFFDTNTKINTGLPSVEVLMVVFDHISSHGKHSRSTDFMSLLLYLFTVNSFQNKLDSCDGHFSAMIQMFITGSCIRSECLRIF